MVMSPLGPVKLRTPRSLFARVSDYGRPWRPSISARTAATGELCTSSVPGTIVLHLAQQGQPPEQADA